MSGSGRTVISVNQDDRRSARSQLPASKGIGDRIFTYSVRAVRLIAIKSYVSGYKGFGEMLDAKLYCIKGCDIPLFKPDVSESELVGSLSGDVGLDLRKVDTDEFACRQGVGHEQKICAGSATYLEYAASCRISRVYSKKAAHRCQEIWMSLGKRQRGIRHRIKG